jgi:glycosyltransferase involved in cell wall biosynthesis
MTTLETAVGEGELPPLISVITPVYNAEAFLERAVRSALDAHSALEVVLAEDASQDGSLAVCERLAAENERVRLVPNPERINRGAGGARNVAIRASRGKYIAFLDADDWYLPDRFDVDVPMMEADPDIDGVYGAVMRSREDGHVPVLRDNDDMKTVTEPIPPDELFDALLVRDRGSFHTAGITARRDLFDRSGLFPEDLPLAQDMALWLRMAATGSLVAGCIAEPIAVYRRHAANRATRFNPYWRKGVRRYLSSSLRWAKEHRLDAAKIRLLREALVTEVVRNSARGGRRGLRRIPAGLYYLAVTSWGNPSVLPVFCSRVIGWLTGRPAHRIPDASRGLLRRRDEDR